MLLAIINQLRPWWIPQCLLRVGYFFVTNYLRFRARRFVRRLNRDILRLSGASLSDIQRLVTKPLPVPFVAQHSTKMRLDKELGAKMASSLTANFHSPSDATSGAKKRLPLAFGERQRRELLFEAFDEFMRVSTTKLAVSAKIH